MICLEGLDGSGKTTQSKLLYNCLIDNNIPSLYSREPGGSTVGELLRQIILKQSLNSIGDILLYTLNRHVHIHETILPQQKEGKIIILDRYLFSTIVYQGGGNETLIKQILYLHQNFNNNIFPNLTLVLDIDPQTAIKRIKDRNLNKQYYYDKKPVDFHKKIAVLYKQSCKYYNGKISFIDANLSCYELHKNIVNKINNELHFNLKPLSQQSCESKN